MNKIHILLIVNMFLFAAFSWSQTADKSDPISGLIMDTFLLPAKLLAATPQAEPSITEDQKRVYIMETVPLDLDRDVALLVERKTGRVAFLWSQKESSWIKPDKDVQKYLQERYNNRHTLREEAETHRILKEQRQRHIQIRQSGFGQRSTSRSSQ